MLSKTLTVVNPSGLHLRPAGVLSQTAMKFKCDVIIECGEKRIIAKSVLNVMAAGIKSGTEITLICDGEDEAAAMETISQALESGLGEMYGNRIEATYGEHMQGMCFSCVAFFEGGRV